MQEAVGGQAMLDKLVASGAAASSADVGAGAAAGAVALLPGLPPNLEGVSFAAPVGSSPTSPVSPDDTGPDDTDVIPKSFVNVKLTAPSRISFKALKLAFNKYKDDIGKTDYNDFKELENEWTVAKTKQKRDIAHNLARQLYRLALFDLR